MKSQQTGAISLRLAALSVAIVSCAAMAALFSMRYERNLFAEMWEGAKKSTQKTSAQLSRQINLQDVSGAASSEIVKCKVNGQWVYSNSGCKGSHVQKIEVHDTSGFDAPKTAPVPKLAPEQVRAKMMERAIDGPPAAGEQ